MEFHGSMRRVNVQVHADSRWWINLAFAAKGKLMLLAKVLFVSIVIINDTYPSRYKITQAMRLAGWSDGLLSVVVVVDWARARSDVTPSDIGLDRFDRFTTPLIHPRLVIKPSLELPIPKRDNSGNSIALKARSMNKYY